MIGFIQSVLALVALGTWATGALKHEKLPEKHYGHEWAQDGYNAGASHTDAHRHHYYMVAIVLAIISVLLFLI